MLVHTEHAVTLVHIRTQGLDAHRLALLHQLGDAFLEVAAILGTGKHLSHAAQSKPAAQTGKQMGLAEQEGFYPIEESVEDDDLPF